MAADAKRQEERVKLFATALSNVGVASIISGVVAPLVLGRFNDGLAAGAFLLGLGFTSLRSAFCTMW